MEKEVKFRWGNSREYTPCSELTDEQLVSFVDPYYACIERSDGSMYPLPLAIEEGDKDAIKWMHNWTEKAHIYKNSEGERQIAVWARFNRWEGKMRDFFPEEHLRL